MFVPQLKRHFCTTDFEMGFILQFNFYSRIVQISKDKPEIKAFPGLTLLQTGTAFGQSNLPACTGSDCTALNLLDLRQLSEAQPCPNQYLPSCPGIQLVPAKGKRAIAAASTVRATRSSRSRWCTFCFPQARAIVVNSMLSVFR